jgi:hypothetical protein
VLLAVLAEHRRGVTSRRAVAGSGDEPNVRSGVVKITMPIRRVSRFPDDRANAPSSLLVSARSARRRSRVSRD